MPLTSPGNDDDTGENHQPTLRKNTAEPVEQTLKQNSVHCLVVTFPYSNMRYVVALPGENAECVCEGLETVFSHVGWPRG